MLRMTLCALVVGWMGMGVDSVQAQCRGHHGGSHWQPSTNYNVVPYSSTYRNHSSNHFPHYSSSNRSGFHNYPTVTTYPSTWQPYNGQIYYPPQTSFSSRPINPGTSFNRTNPSFTNGSIGNGGFNRNGSIPSTQNSGRPSGGQSSGGFNSPGIANDAPNIRVENGRQILYHGNRRIGRAN